MILPVILAGGYGERLWPLSRQSYPKQFLSLITSSSLLQDTIARLPKTENILPPLIICQEEHRFLAAEQVRTSNCEISGILLEPVAKSTAFATALAACWASHTLSADVTLLILSADHLISCQQTFATAIVTAYELAATGYLVTFGIKPNRIETAYGYITLANSIDSSNSTSHKTNIGSESNAYRIAKFIEKPSTAVAEELIATNNVLWNSGMFMFTCANFLQELATYQPMILTAAQTACTNLTVDRDFIRPDANACSTSPKISIDYAIMEKTKHAAVIPLQTQWSDIGNWQAIWENQPKDDNNNAISGNAIPIDTNNSLINSQYPLVATIGINDLIIIATKDAVLIADKKHAARTKEVVEILKARNATEISQPSRVHRPWGFFESISVGDRFQVKLITVAVNQKLSMQLHHHRSEHWVVVNGSAKITRDEEVFFLTENQSTYIPVGVKHRLENVGKIPLEIIEVQSGSYLGEDDIIRFHDEHGRITMDNNVVNNMSKQIVNNQSES